MSIIFFFSLIFLSLSLHSTSFLRNSQRFVGFFQLASQTSSQLIYTCFFAVKLVSCWEIILENCFKPERMTSGCHWIAHVRHKMSVRRRDTSSPLHSPWHNTWAAVKLYPGHRVLFTLAPAPPSVFYHRVHSDPARHCLQRTVVLKLESQIHGGAILERLRFNIDANFGSSFQRCEAVSCLGVLMRNWSFCNIDLSHLSLVGWQPGRSCEGALATLPLKMALHRTGLTGQSRLCTHAPARLDHGREEIVPHPLTLGTIYI